MRIADRAHAWRWWCLPGSTGRTSPASGYSRRRTRARCPCRRPTPGLRGSPAAAYIFMRRIDLCSTRVSSRRSPARLPVTSAASGRRSAVSRKPSPGAGRPAPVLVRGDLHAGAWRIDTRVQRWREVLDQRRACLAAAISLSPGRWPDVGGAAFKGAGSRSGTAFGATRTSAASSPRRRVTMQRRAAQPGRYAGHPEPLVMPMRPAWRRSRRRGRASAVLAASSPRNGSDGCLPFDPRFVLLDLLERAPRSDGATMLLNQS